ncbi:uncharacterized protein ASCRUDRAFT_74449 [Ascoidea rubescens DSM 1968]|uniref:Uncharacterized protein n=1 Tax=Ascoidea rubescens DSM 1968 TaxID=1344418 RepID=A0A1D2VN69_9ASCO|nr:hypothetical protein ASCRUDRAFT_74449 [Ascoidea rubescens DSM 1968]ODV63039.1 hypothetical protein ASCRUDRAFT_74449 [Ascoidea rubescens DSM 1968]
MLFLATRLALARAYSTEAPIVVKTQSKARVGSFKGGVLGFLFGVTLTGFGSYYYLMDEYRTANSAVVSEVLALQKSIKNLEAQVKVLEAQRK